MTLRRLTPGGLVGLFVLLVLLAAASPFINDALPWTGRADLERVRKASILEPPPGAVLIARQERRTKENVFLVGRQGARVEVVWASPWSPAQLLEYYRAEHIGEFALNQPAPGILKLRGCLRSDCAATFAVVRVGEDPTFRRTVKPTIVPVGARAFAQVTVLDPR